MTSSIYRLIPSLTATTITTPGSGYTTTPTVTIDPPPSGRTAAGTANIANGVINAISAITGGSGYTVGEEVTLVGNLSGIDATGIVVITGDAVTAIVFTSRGSGFVGADAETVTITGVTSGANNASFTVSTIANEAVSSITLTNGGSGYTSTPNITITGGGGSGGTGTGVFATRTTPIPINSNILTSDIAIPPSFVSPGGGGILRLYFAFNFDVTPGAISVTNNGSDKGALNADNDSQIIGNGYYRFDIDVEAGDNINLQLKGTASATQVDGINFIRAHLVQFGA